MGVRFRSLPLFLSVLPLLGGLHLPLAAQERPGATAGTALLVAAAERSAALDSFCADFEQHLEVRVMGESHESRGVLCQRAPDRLRMEFTEPEGDLVIGDGEFLWAYLPSMEAGQVLRLPLAEAGDRFDVRREFLDDPLGKYEVTDLGPERVEGVDTRGFRLVPRENARYHSADIWIDVGTLMLKRVEIEELTDSMRRLTFGTFREDPGLDAGAFTFVVPEGVRVVIR